ncbi:unnamed protein product [Caenorhabditis bovis]|uniref:Uncharacterized protein n=1 Tax=Caenorhabditis bovis TaxID=2654633 RepID=A0A8S1EF74_9PELO|nr:unnamed protein product [Caenorhabditis bovis]
MKSDGSTVPVTPFIAEIREGHFSKNTEYSLWLLLFLAGILFLIILAFLCFMCWKQNERSRVHTQQGSAQQNAFMNEPNRQLVGTVNPPGTNSISVPVHQSSDGESQKSSSTLRRQSSDSDTAPAPISAPTPSAAVAPVPAASTHISNKKFPLSVEPKQVITPEKHSEEQRHIEETKIMGNNDRGVEGPKAAPRSLPPAMPGRETTFQSINTRDGSSLRTRRTREMFDRPVMNVLDNVSAISLDEFWSNKKH